jgi:hypothetical protein
MNRRCARGVPAFKKSSAALRIGGTLRGSESSEVHVGRDGQAGNQWLATDAGALELRFPSERVLAKGDQPEDAVRGWTRTCADTRSASDSG